MSHISRKVRYSLVLPPLFFLYVLVFYAFLVTIYYGLTDYFLFTEELPQFVGGLNYVKVLTSRRFISSLTITGLFTAYVVPIEMVLGLFLALFLNRKLRGMEILRTIVIWPMVMAPVIGAMMWTLVLDPVTGPISYLMSIVGLPAVEWFGRYMALITIGLIDIWQWSPFFVIIFAAGLGAIRPELLEAASIDGLSFLTKLRVIIIPNLKKIILIAILIRTIDSIKTFDVVFSTTKGGPGSATELLSVYNYLKVFKYGFVGEGSVISFLTFIIIMALGNALVYILSRK